jgi:hypothetical protein
VATAILLHHPCPTTSQNTKKSRCVEPFLPHLPKQILPQKKPRVTRQYNTKKKARDPKKKKEEEKPT